MKQSKIGTLSEKFCKISKRLKMDHTCVIIEIPSKLLEHHRATLDAEYWECNTNDHEYVAESNTTFFISLSEMHQKQKVMHWVKKVGSKTSSKGGR